jgi:predicted transcriptional regulator
MVTEEDTPGATLSTVGELEERRAQVMRLRHRRLSEAAIARALGVSASTVSRDLAHIRAHSQESFGPNPTFDASIFIGESLARYEDIESAAMHDSAKAGITLKERMRCFQVAMVARNHQVSLLLDTGVIARSLGTLTVGLPTAAQIRTALQSMAIDDDLDGPVVFDVAK